VPAAPNLPAAGHSPQNEKTELMTEFHYVAQDDEGRRFNGSLKAESKDTALKILSERYSIVTRLEHRATQSPIGLLSHRIQGEDLLGFCETLSAMLDGGITLKRALDTILGDTENKAMRNVIMDLSARVGTGDSLSSALKNHSYVFDSFFIHMVEAGESSGELPEMIKRVSGYLEKMEEMKDKVKSALTYPAVVLAFAGLLVAAILAFGVPYLQELYDGLGIELPWATRMLSAVGMFLGNNLLLLLIVAIGLLFLCRVFLRSPAGQLMLDKIKLRAPILKGVFRYLYTARFARTMALLYSSGIPLLDALELTGRSIGNSIVAETAFQTQEELRRGSNLSDSLRLNPYFSDAAIGLVSAGEESGTLDRMLLKVAVFYDRKVDNKLEAATSMVEPLIMIVVGFVIGGIILALGLPFLTLASNF
jgi:type IV pilus assembly protein PilC